MARRNQETKYCYFCSYNVDHVDYKDTELLDKLTSNYKKILPSHRLGTCSRHQRKLATAVKRARYMGLLAFVPDQK